METIKVNQIMIEVYNEHTRKFSPVPVVVYLIQNNHVYFYELENPSRLGCHSKIFICRYFIEYPYYTFYKELAKLT